jgi:hypothetical protein
MGYLMALLCLAGTVCVGSGHDLSEIQALSLWLTVFGIPSHKVAIWKK